MEASTADTIRIEQSVERFAITHDSSSVATSTHDEHFAYVVERITIDSSGKVLRRDIERGKYSARQADTTSAAHNVTSVTNDSVSKTGETHAMKKNEVVVKKNSSIGAWLKPIGILALIVGIVLLGVWFFEWSNLKWKK